MRKQVKIWLIMAASFMLVGCIVFGGVMTVLGWDFTKLSTVKYQTKDLEVNEDYKNISLVTKTADVLFVPSENAKTSVVCYQQTNRQHAVAVQDSTLVIEVVDKRKWYEYIGIDFNTPKITVYLPAGEYGTLLVKSATGDVEIPKEFKFESIDISESTGKVTNFASASGDVKIKTSTGDIRVENISAGTLSLSVSTGKISASSVTCQGDVSINVSTGKTNLSDVACKSVVSKGNTGDFSLKNVLATEKFSIERSTGDITLDGCDAAELFVQTDTGNVSGWLLSEKVFMAETDTGRVDVPKTVTGGRCQITTDTGDIKLAIGSVGGNTDEG